MPAIWNNGMLEQWNNGQKRITFVFWLRILVRLWRIGINFYCFSMDERSVRGDGMVGLNFSQFSSIPEFQYPMSWWPNPAFVLDYKSRPGGMSSKYGGNRVTDMRCGTEHNPYLDWKLSSQTWSFCFFWSDSINLTLTLHKSLAQKR